ncbi:WSC domain-containing protein ARB_07867 [Trichoderma asperellum]|uniref:WSC domain-containing protein ARB_07867 n=1 Tax=Trichoderma asperellum TaxID=101201 RepID=A0A6V8QIC7_TRIAP|nr:WSC domain-containing protein ARB_07867 [Trichoderma asperellum]
MSVSRSLVAAVATLSFVASTQAWNVELPPCLDKFQPFVYSGCFQDGGPGKPNALIFRSSLSSDNMTVEECVADCKGNGFRYAGLEYYGVCFCGGTVDGPQVDEAQCSFPCNGNKSETCGGNNLLSVWQDPTFPTKQVTIGDYKAAGCYSDNSQQGRALSWSADVDSSTFTTESCLTACEAEGFPLAGTEFGGECWCGNVLANSTTKVDDSQCNFPCKGNSSETCGGSGLLNLYIATDLESLEPCGWVPPSSSSTTTSVSTTSLPPPPPTSTTTPCTTTSISTTSLPPPPPTSTTTPCEPTSTSTTPPPPPPTTTKCTTTSKSTSTTTTSSLCTVTVTTPPSCEYKCGDWCFPPLPDWSNEKDCLKAYSTCAAGVASCFAQAGFPGALQCFNFGQWCSGIQQYCSSTCLFGKCSKGDCWNHNPGQGGSPPKTSTTVIPCPPTTTTKPPATSTKPSHCPPPPTNICTQPSNSKYGYGPGNPVGGISLPIVSCNDIYSDWRNNPFKLYINQNSWNCPSYPPSGCGNACSDACKEQYTQCTNVYQKGCQDGSGGRWKRGEGAKRALGISQFTQNWGFGDNSPSNAAKKCQAQYQDCLAVNKNVNPKQQCKTWGC